VRIHRASTTQSRHIALRDSKAMLTPRRVPKRYEPPAMEELQAIARSVVDASSGEVVLTRSPNDMPLEIGHAAVARNRQLLSGVLALVDAELKDVCGPLFRVIYETWLVGLYGMLGGPKAVERLVSQQDRQLRPIIELMGGEAAEAGTRLPVEELAREVRRLLRARQNPNADFPTGAYDVFYRYESYRGIHAGLGSLEGHVVRDGDQTRIVRHRPDEDAEFRHRFFVAIAIVVSGAHITASEAGQSHAALGQIANWIHSHDPREI
jgi:hypothetical protein